MTRLLNFFDPHSGTVDYRTEILSGLTVALALVPEAVAFALLAGLSPITGLYAAFVMGLVTSVAGGRPGMISGATGAVAIVLVALAKSHGPEYIFAAVVLAGLLQVSAGALKLGKLMRLVPHPAIFGFVNGLAIVIFLAQLVQFQVPVLGADGLPLLDDAGEEVREWMTGATLATFSALTALAMLIIWGLPKLTRAVPSALAAILAVWALVVGFGIDTTSVGDMAGPAGIAGGFPPFHLPAVPLTLDTLLVIAPYAAVVAGVGLIESLLTLNIIDEITETRGDGNREAVAQGAANVLSGLFSGMGGCAMIGQSLINVSAGARARLSGIVASLLLLSFIMFGSGLIERVPMAALTGLMIMVAIGTFEWASLRTFAKMPASDVLVMVLVTLVTVLLHNLALAVLVGVVISALVFAWDNAKRIRARKRVDAEGRKHYEIYGPLFFGSVAVFNEKFDVPGDPERVVVDFTEGRVVDMSAIEALHRLTERYRRAGKHVELTGLGRDSRRLLADAAEITALNVAPAAPPSRGEAAAEGEVALA